MSNYKFNNTYVLDAIEEEFKKYSKEIQKLNSNPSSVEYDEKVKNIRIELNDKIIRIFYNYTM